MKKERVSALIFTAILLSVLSINLCFAALSLFSSYAPSSADLNSKFQIACNFASPNLPCTTAIHGGVVCKFNSFVNNNMTVVFDCNATKAGMQDNYCNLFSYTKDSRCVPQQNKIQSTNVTVSNKIPLVFSSAPASVNLNQNFQIKCDFGKALGCVQAYHNGVACSWGNKWEGTAGVFNCVANTAGTIDNYCNLLNNPNIAGCVAQQNKIQSTNVIGLGECSKDSDCGALGISWGCGQSQDCYSYLKSCSYEVNYTCENPGTINSKCSNKIKETCSCCLYGCQADGKCSVSQGAQLKNYNVPSSVNLNDKFQIKCDFGVPYLGCVQAKHGNNKCIYNGYIGNNSIWNCTATASGMIDNYCNTINYATEKRINCIDQIIKINSTNVVIPVDFNISIATLNDSYAINEQIKLTDPPDEYTNNKFITDKNQLSEGFENNENNDAENTEIQNQNTSILSNGYIVEFEDKPLVVKDKELKNTARENEKKIKSMSPINPLKYVYSFALTKEKDVQNELKKYKKEIESKKEKIRNKISDKLNKELSSEKPNSWDFFKSLFTGKAIATPAPDSDLKIIANWDSVFNGIVINISTGEVDKIKNIPGVKSVSPNLIVQANLMDSVPVIGADKVWQLDNSSNNCITSGKDCMTGKGITIGIIDTGVDYTHGDLGGCFGSNCKIAGGYDFVNNDNDPMDDHGHGTHCAAIAAGNGVLKGVAPDAKIYAYKVLNSIGSGDFASIISAVERAMDPNQDKNFSDHLDVISLSLGGDCRGNYNAFCGPDDPASIAIDNAVNAGVIAVVAAANAGPGSSTIGTPGTARKAITVGATFKKNYTGTYWKDINPGIYNITSFSSRGPVVWSGGSMIKPDIVAPGAIICAAEYDSAWSDRKCLDDKHVQISGTSMATPHVAGAVALLKQAHPDWSPEEIKESLKDGAVNLSYDVNSQGAGLIDIKKSVSMINRPLTGFIQPVGEEIFGTSIQINGSVNGGNFKGYTLYYSVNNNPIFTEICSSSNIVHDSVLCNWDIKNLADNKYILKLVIKNDLIEKNYYDYFTLKNTKMFNPRDLIGDYKGLDNQEIFTIWKNISVGARVIGYGLVNYDLTICPSYESSCISNAIIPKNNFRDPVLNNNISIIDTSKIKDSGFYNITLTSYYNDGRINKESHMIFIETDIRKGWPQDSPTIVDNSQWGLSSLSFENPIISDINNDGKNELIWLHQTLYVTDSNGNILAGWPQKNPYVPYNPADPNTRFQLHFSTGASVSDIDKDGKKEIILTDNYVGFVFVYKYDGTLILKKSLLNDFNFIPPYLNYSSSYNSIADIENDGNLEIIVSQYFYLKNLTLIHVLKDGNEISGFPIKSYGSPLLSRASVVDLDNDGQKEIFFITQQCNQRQTLYVGNTCSNYTTNIYGFDNKGNALPNWPKIFNYISGDERNQSGYWRNGFADKLISADLDNDGQREIIATAKGGYIFAWKKDGSILKNYPIDIGWYSPIFTNMGFDNFNSPAIGDVDNDGMLELFLRGETYYYSFQPETAFGCLFGLKANGSIIKGFPECMQTLLPNPSQPKSFDPRFGQEEILSGFYGSPSIVDLDSDNQKEIVMPSNMAYLKNGLLPFYAFNIDGSVVNGFPKYIPGFPGNLLSDITAQDIDNDGKNELIFETYRNIFVYNTEGSPQNNAWPMSMYDELRSGCYNCDKTILYRPQSKIVNLGSSVLSGNLSIILQKNISNTWQNQKIIFNQKVSIPSQGLLKLDTGKDNLNNQAFAGFNNMNAYATSAGDYMVYARFESNGKSAEKSWNFKVA